MTMLLIINFFGDAVPMQVPVDITIGEFKQLLQANYGIPVSEQRLGGLPGGVGDGAEVGAVIADGDTVVLSRVDHEEEHRQAQDLVMTDEYVTAGRGVVVQGLRGLRDQARSPLYTLDTPFIDEDDIDQGEVVTALGEVNSRMVWDRLQPQTDFRTALGDARRNRTPLISIIYSTSDQTSVRFLEQLAEKLRDPDYMAQTTIFASYMVDVSSPMYEDFIQVIENNQGLQDQFSSAWGASTLRLPLVAVLVPVSGGELKMAKLLSADISIEDFFNSLLSVIAEHSERLEVERAATAVGTETQQIQDEISTALQMAMDEDARKAEEERLQRVKEEQEVKNAEAAAREEARLADEAEAALKAKKAGVARRRESRLSELGIEPEKSKDTVDIMFRLPNGGTAKRRFAIADDLAKVFCFLDLHEDVRSQFEDTDNCKLIMSYPKKTLTMPEHGSRVLKDLDLTGMVALQVHQ